MKLILREKVKKCHKLYARPYMNGFERKKKTK
jgi:hypothetical protein